MRWMRWLAACALPLLLGACASSMEKGSALEQRQHDFSAAVRWGNFEGAWSAVDPEYRAANPKTALEFERYDQVQVSGYSDLSAEVSADGQRARREIQVNVINKHTMTERSLRYTETWRFDPQAKVWWVTSGLPDFWAGQ